MLIDRSRIAQLIPHAGDMCLLDGAVSWNQTRIECVTTTHRLPQNPMRRNGQLGSLCGVEYAAQAMALHAALVAGNNDIPHHGYLASLRAVNCYTDRLDLIPGALHVEAVRLHHELGRVIYTFVLRHDDHALLDGRAVVVLDQAKG